MMLPEAVRMVNLLVTKGHRVYVHCTAGINRANLVVVAYLYFIQGLRRDEAVNMVKDCRPIANPYLDCLSEAKRRILGGFPGGSKGHGCAVETKFEVGQHTDPSYLERALIWPVVSDECACQPEAALSCPLLCRWAERGGDGSRHRDLRGSPGWQAQRHSIL